MVSLERLRGHISPGCGSLTWEPANGEWMLLTHRISERERERGGGVKLATSVSCCEQLGLKILECQ